MPAPGQSNPSCPVRRTTAAARRTATPGAQDEFTGQQPVYDQGQSGYQEQQTGQTGGYGPAVVGTLDQQRDVVRRAVPSRRAVMACRRGGAYPAARRLPDPSYPKQGRGGATTTGGADAQESVLAL